MTIRLPRRATQVRASLLGKPLLVSYTVNRVTRNLYVKGTYDNEPLQGFVYRHGGGVIQCDALGRRDRVPFIEALCNKLRFKIQGARVAS